MREQLLRFLLRGLRMLLLALRCASLHLLPAFTGVSPISVSLSAVCPATLRCTSFRRDHPREQEHEFFLGRPCRADLWNGVSAPIGVVQFVKSAWND
jgi:hypothetical protein